jgi:hypothetical protein
MKPDNGPAAARASSLVTRGTWLTPAEQTFLPVLQDVVAPLVVFPKIALNSLLISTNPSDTASAMNRVAGLSVDFLVCYVRTLKPYFAVQLDDPNCSFAEYLAQAALVEESLQEADFPLVRVQVQEPYSIEEIKNQIKWTLRSHQKAGSAPLCPKCNLPMVLRAARITPQVSWPYYGCQNAPACRITLAAPTGELSQL